jgi:ABC-type Mn2+/Zn2+ transport system ATPase subunit
MIEVKYLDIYYGNKMVYKDINLTWQPGHIAALLGANGSGKTTLFPKNIGWDGAWELKINQHKGWIHSYSLDSTVITYLQVGMLAFCVYLFYKACTQLISETKISQ